MYGRDRGTEKFNLEGYGALKDWKPEKVERLARLLSVIAASVEIMKLAGEFSIECEGGRFYLRTIAGRYHLTDTNELVFLLKCSACDKWKNSKIVIEIGRASICKTCAVNALDQFEKGKKNAKSKNEERQITETNEGEEAKEARKEKRKESASMGSHA